MKTLMAILAVWATLFCTACTAPKAPGREPAELRILSYNIHIGVGLDGERSLERIAEVILRENPDLVALQEVDRNTARSVHVDQAAELARLTGMHVVFGKAIDLQGGEYGLAILSRYEILESENRPLPHAPNREARTAMAVRINVAGRPLLFANTHLDHTARESDRPAQVAHIHERFGHRDLPVLLAGDFNATPNSDVIQTMQQSWANLTSGESFFTFPANQPDRHIDYIFARPGDAFELVSSRVLEEPVASDHRPVFAVVRLR